MFVSTHDKLWKQQEIPVLDKVAPCTALRQVVNFGVVCYEVLSWSVWRDESNCIRMTLNKCCQKWLHKSTYEVFTLNKFWWEQRTVTLVWWICQSLETSLEGYLFFCSSCKMQPLPSSNECWNGNWTWPKNCFCASIWRRQLGTKVANGSLGFTQFASRKI